MPQITLNSKQVKQLSDFAHKHDLDKFFLAKDDGAYVGANANGEKVIFYFRGMDPNKDEDAWDNAMHAFGGDDFGEFLSIEFIHKMALKIEPKVTIKVTATHIKMDGTFKKEGVAPTAAPAPKAPKQTKGQMIRTLLAKGLDVKHIAELTQSTVNSVRWHKSQMNAA